MKRGAALPMAIGAGYVLGRRHRLRLAFIVAIATATGRLGNASGQLFRRGAHMLGASPQLTRLAGLGAPLAIAGKAAAASAVTTRIRAISDRLNKQTEALLAAGRDGEEAGQERDRGRPDRAQRPEDREPEDREPEDREPEGPEPEVQQAEEPESEAPAEVRDAEAGRAQRAVRPRSSAAPVRRRAG